MVPVGGPRGTPQPPPPTVRLTQAGAGPRQEWRRHDTLVYFTRLHFQGPQKREKQTKTSLSRPVQFFPAPSFPHTSHAARTAHPPHAALSFKLYLSFGSSRRESFQAERGLSGAKSLSWRSKADRETGDLLFYSARAKNWNPSQTGHVAFFPFFSLLQSNLFSAPRPQNLPPLLPAPFVSPGPPPPPHLVVPLLRRTHCKRGGGGE